MGLFDGIIDGATATPKFELVLDLKDAKGKPTGIRKSITSDSAADIGDAWEKFNPPIKKHRRRKAKKNKNAGKLRETLPVGAEADRLAREAATYAENKQKLRGVRKEAVINDENVQL